MSGADEDLKLAYDAAPGQAELERAKAARRQGGGAPGASTPPGLHPGFALQGCPRTLRPGGRWRVACLNMPAHRRRCLPACRCSALVQARVAAALARKQAAQASQAGKAVVHTGRWAGGLASCCGLRRAWGWGDGQVVQESRVPRPCLVRSLSA